uniref:CCHC-type domain-containing protein n=1 Tax=Gadus morhua TaxID=8049 RepID=A0A8C5CGL7_GADMO
FYIPINPVPFHLVSACVCAWVSTFRTPLLTVRTGLNIDPADAESLRQMISRQGTLLGQHDQVLQEITSNLRELAGAVRSQRATSPDPSVAVPGPSASSREPYIPTPERYEGDLGSCRSFLLQCSLVFELQPLTYPTDRSRVAYLIGSLRGEALAWATAVWERGSAVCSDYSAFTAEMRMVFDHPVRGKEASQRLLHLRQGSRSVASFADQLTSREESADLDELIALSIRFDNRLSERRRERGSRPVSHRSEPPATPRPSASFSAPPRRERGHSPEPMQIGRTNLSPAVRERRMHSGSCLYCGLSGHLRSGCPSLSGKDRACH